MFLLRVFCHFSVLDVMLSWQHICNVDILGKRLLTAQKYVFIQDLSKLTIVLFIILIIKCIHLFLCNAVSFIVFSFESTALIVRFLTRRFIGEYASSSGIYDHIFSLHCISVFYCISFNFIAFYYHFGVAFELLAKTKHSRSVWNTWCIQ